MKYLIIDVEASGFDGFPIEVGWCDQDGQSESHLIRPAWDWTDWDIRAERVHGISRKQLATQGEPHEAVAELVANMLALCRKEKVTVASDNPGYDREWLVTLLRRARLDDDVVLADISELYRLAVVPVLAALPQAFCQDDAAGHQCAQIPSAAVIKAAQSQVARPPKHRAADDARCLRDMVETIRAQFRLTLN